MDPEVAFLPIHFNAMSNDILTEIYLADLIKNSYIY